VQSYVSVAGQVYARDRETSGRQETVVVCEDGRLINATRRCQLVDGFDFKRASIPFVVSGDL